MAAADCKGAKCAVRKPRGNRLQQAPNFSYWTAMRRCVQHIAALWRNEDLGRAVNLVGGSEVGDIYSDIKRHVREQLEADPGEVFSNDWWLSQWWRHNDWSAVTRAIFKGPTMTFPYGVSPRDASINRGGHPRDCGRWCGPGLDLANNYG